MTSFQRFQKRLLDLFLSVVGIILFGWLILLAALIARIDTGLNGFFRQSRIGKDGRPFKVIKIRSMKPVQGVDTSVTTDKDPRISPVGRFWRKSKIDELPQLWNVLIGNMSFVGPRPDVPGFADKLEGEDRIVLSIRPGITGPASLQFKNEEHLLAQQSDPEHYNREVIWPEKVKINRAYIGNYRLSKDLYYIWKTVFN
ncbi:MAG: sugar transferase [Owenweeksia sp.]|nr:sugar transferase [Owenweeksia sp.]